MYPSHICWYVRRTVNLGTVLWRSAQYIVFKLSGLDSHPTQRVVTSCPHQRLLAHSRVWPIKRGNPQPRCPSPHNGMWPSACKFTKQVARLIADRGPCLDHGHQKRDFATFQALIVRPSSVGDHNELCLPRVPRYGPMEDQAQPWLRVVNHLQRYGSVEHLRRSR